MNRTVSIVLLVIGVLLLLLGWNASQSASSEISEALTGTPTNKAMWLILGGIACAVAGGVSLNRGSK